MKAFLNSLFLATLMTIAFSFQTTARAGDEDLQYFKQFLYKVVPTGEDPDFPVYYYELLGTDSFNEIPVSPTQYYSTPTSFYLFEDGTYQGNYREYLHTRGRNDFEIRGCVTFSGTWSVPDKELVIMKDGKVLVTGARHIDQGQYGVKFTFKDSIILPELKGHSVNGGIVQSNFPVEQSRCW